MIGPLIGIPNTYQNTKGGLQENLISKHGIRLWTKMDNDINLIFNS